MTSQERERESSSNQNQQVTEKKETAASKYSQSKKSKLESEIDQSPLKSPGMLLRQQSNDYNKAASPQNDDQSADTINLMDDQLTMTPPGRSEMLNETNHNLSSNPRTNNPQYNIKLDKLIQNGTIQHDENDEAEIRRASGE